VGVDDCAARQSADVGKGLVAQCGQEWSANGEEGHQGGQRVARESDDEAAIGQFSQGGRVSGPHRDTVNEEPPAQRGNRSPEMIRA
jgi:hypothetical protein